MHEKTLRGTFVLDTGKHTRNLNFKVREMADDISAQGEPGTPLHLKIVAWQEKGRLPANTYLEDFKSALMPSQYLLRKLDPNEDMDCRLLGPIVDDLHDKWVRMVIDDVQPDVKDAV
jgi:hypothetical protein